MSAVGRWPLRDSWEWSNVGGIASIIGGGTPDTSEPSNFAEHGHAWVTPADLTGYSDTYITNGRRDLSEKGLKDSSARLLPKGTVLFSSRAPIGHCAIAGGELCTNQGFRSLVLESGVVPEYVRYYLISAREYAQSLASGTTFKELSGLRFAELQIPIAPTAEQDRIVARIDELFSDIDAGVANLKRAQALLKRYRQSVLNAAVTGELTREWRGDRTLSEGPPSTWTRKRIGDLAQMVQYGTSARCESDLDGVPVLRMGNIVDGKIEPSILKFLPRDHREFPDLLLRPGDLLFNRTNSAELVGKTAVYKGIPNKCSFASYLIRVRLQGMNPELVAAYINSSFGRNWVRTVVSQQVGQANVNGTKLKALEVPVPPESEQPIIVERMELALSLCDAASRALEEQDAKVSALRQSILRAAFSGRLVPQNPADEPAGALLARIRAARAAAHRGDGRGNRRRATA